MVNQQSNRFDQQEVNDQEDPDRYTQLDTQTHFMSINNVSSYILSCEVHGTPVSFLIDTGAGVSLLNKEVWDRIQLKAGDLNLVTNHRLVEVDGIPLKVQGSLIAPITISNSSITNSLLQKA